MHGLTTDQRAMRTTHDDWSDQNARGLACAAVGAWSDAADAFASAADVVATRTDVASHEALALVLNNLAQASFRAGHVEDGIRHAQRACSLRAALVGEDAIAVARARSDLAVMLGSVGRADEGLGLIARAIAGIERSAGDEDLRLSSVLENAARLAMAAGQPSTAEPYLIRLHALLAVHDLPTDAADRLLERVANHRADGQRMLAAMNASYTAPVEAAVESEPMDTMRITANATPADVVAFIAAEASLDEASPFDAALDEASPVDAALDEASPVDAALDETSPADAALDTASPAERSPESGADDEYDEFDDQPLRDAVRLTDVLLRSTPSGSRAITPVSVPVIADAGIAELSVSEIEAPAMPNLLGLDFDLVESDGAEADGTESIPVTAGLLDQIDTQQPDTDDVFGNATFDLVDLSPASTAADLVPPPGVSVPAHPHDMLGFVVEYGTPTEATVPDPAARAITPTAPAQLSAQTPTTATTTGPHRTTPRGTLVIMPSPSSSHRSIGTHTARQLDDETGDERAAESDAPGLTLHTLEELDGARIRRPNMRAGRALAPRSSRGLIIAGVVTTAIAAVAGWLVWRGGL